MSCEASSNAKMSFPVRCFPSGPCTSQAKWENHQHRLHHLTWQTFRSNSHNYNFGRVSKFFSRGSWFSLINHSAFSFHSKFFAELYLAIRSWTMLVVLDLTTTRTGELSDGKSGASFRTWQNCASLLFKWRVMNDRLPFYRLGGLIARNILKDQITNTTILQTYAESPRNKTHMANFEYDLLLGLPH